MASKEPFSFASTRIIPPIPCVQWGSSMYCVRREPIAGNERQTFICSACASEVERISAQEASDHEIQRTAENLAGIRRP